MTRPLLLLDVDGVLNPFGDECPPGYTDYDLFPDEEPVRVCVQHGVWIAELLTTFDVAWATGWNDDANRILAPLLGIPVLPVVTMPPPPFPPSEKVPRVAAFAHGRPTAWIDDVVTADAVAWTEARLEPTILISVDPMFGLTREHVDRALVWAAGL